MGRAMKALVHATARMPRLEQREDQDHCDCKDGTQHERQHRPAVAGRLDSRDIHPSRRVPTRPISHHAITPTVRTHGRSPWQPASAKAPRLPSAATTERPGHVAAAIPFTISVPALANAKASLPAQIL
jgi:hypothetical protein